jgi:hypothetical protein
MKVSALIGCTAVLVAGTAMAASYSALVTGKQAHRFITGAPAGSKTLYDQNKDAAASAVFSMGQSDDSQGADDFVVPKGHTWIVKEVDVTGVYYNGSGPATSENVFFYKDKGGLPGDLVVQCLNQNGAGNGTGSFAIVLAADCKAKLRGGKTGKTYWVSVQANMDFIAGQWGWSLSLDTSGNQAAWRDPDGDVCQNWGHIKDCLGADGDLMFALKGKDRQSN